MRTLAVLATLEMFVALAGMAVFVFGIVWGPL